MKGASMVAQKTLYELNFYRWLTFFSVQKRIKSDLELNYILS